MSLTRFTTCEMFCIEYRHRRKLHKMSEKAKSEGFLLGFDMISRSNNVNRIRIVNHMQI